jgi:hypothetical protein
MGWFSMGFEEHGGLRAGDALRRVSAKRFNCFVYLTDPFKFQFKAAIVV